MAGGRPQLGTPFGVDGPWLAAILDVLHDVHDLLDARLPQLEQDAASVSEPAPDVAPSRTEPVSEPDPDDEPKQEELPDPPPRAGRGSGVAEWEAFADLAKVDHPEGASRSDIIAACVAAGVIPAE